MKMFNIRLGAIGDLQALLELEADCFRSDISFNQRQLKYLLSKKSILVATDPKNHAIGQITILKRYHSILNNLRIYNLAVRSSYQGQGIGKALVESALKKYANPNTKRITLEVEEDSPAIAFYAKFGFKIESILKGYYAKDKNGFRMVYHTT